MKTNSCEVWILLIAIVVGFSGCGGGATDTPELGSVTGTLTLDGQPVPDAQISFYPLEGGRAAFAVSEADGSYTLQFNGGVAGAKVGRNRVTITTAKEASGVKGQPEYSPEVKDTIPSNYNGSGKVGSTLEFDVEASDNVIDLSLTS